LIAGVLNPNKKVLGSRHRLQLSLERAKASARQASLVMDEPEEPQREMRRCNARARLFVVHEAGVKPDDIKTYDKGRRKRHTHTV
jgi:hypothetical protein